MKDGEENKLHYTKKENTRNSREGVKNGMRYKIVVPGRPVPKGRPRFAKGHAYTPEKTRMYEELDGVVYIDDKQICSLSIQRISDKEERVEIEIEEMLV
ncbi:MAG: RusA family crossover junction endodeoxyribonuclease [Thermoanaerobacter sp.]|uniref:RusA family crossover junction endodeoxyribonuclease n=1 Tax=Thermoanaerobacter sp. TaxID=1755 RepID=UPI0034642C4D